MRLHPTFCLVEKSRDTRFRQRDQLPTAMLIGQCVQRTCACNGLTTLNGCPLRQAELSFFIHMLHDMKTRSLSLMLNIILKLIQHLYGQVVNPFKENPLILPGYKISQLE
jgi:hypothetical protein